MKWNNLFSECGAGADPRDADWGDRPPKT